MCAQQPSLRLEGKRAQGFRLFAFALSFEKKISFSVPVFAEARPVSIGPCKMPDMGVGNRTLVLRKFTKHF